MQKAGRPISTLALASVVAVFLQITWGGVVRVTGSGLGCPDYPLCHGKVIAPLESEAVIEFSHRLIATVVVLLVLATAAVAWRSHRSDRWVFPLAAGGLFLVVLGAALGGVTVLTELSAGMVIAHLAVAETLLAVMMVLFMVVQTSESPSSFVTRADGSRSSLAVLVPATALMAFALLLTGSYVTVSGAAGACGSSWPLCNGGLPEGYFPWMHMVHRVAALLVGVLVTACVVLAWRYRHERVGLCWIGLMAGVLYLSQVFVGAANIWLTFPLVTKLLHLVTATGVWLAFIAMMVLATLPSKGGVRSVDRA